MSQILITNTKTTSTNFSIHADGAFLGILLPVLKPFGDIKNYFKELSVNTIAISGYKFLGTTICGIALMDLTTFNTAFNEVNIIEYERSMKDITITGVRPGIPILQLHHALYSIKLNEGTKVLSEIVKINLNNTSHCYKALVGIYRIQNVIWNKKGFNIVFPRPSKKIVDKYWLMPVLHW